MTDDVQPPADAAPLRFADTPYVRAQVVLGDRRADGEFQVDTGSNTAVEFWRAFSHSRLGGARGQRGRRPRHVAPERR